MAANHSQPAARDQVLFDAWRQRLDTRARTELIERYLPLARKLAARYARSSEPYDDLLQVASLGLIKAIERYEPARGTAFTSFAVPTILGELKRHFRDACWTVRVDRRSQELSRAVSRARDELSAAGRSPTAIEIAQHAGLELEEVLDGLQAALAYSAVSFDSPATTADGEGNGSMRLADMVGGPDDRLELADERTTLVAARLHLPELEQKLLLLRYDQDLSQREIGELLGISQMHVSRLLRRALDHLRDQLGEEQPDGLALRATAAASAAGNRPMAA